MARAPLSVNVSVDGSRLLEQVQQLAVEHADLRIAVRSLLNHFAPDGALVDPLPVDLLADLRRLSGS